jgi:hypothetical protein
MQAKKMYITITMRKCISFLLISLLLCTELVWAQRAARETAREDDRAARRQWEEEQRADEYATSLRRRDWLKDRLILQLGMGTKFPAMGANWFGFGAGVEYITRWHLSAFATGGFIPSHKDPSFVEGGDKILNFTLDGGMGWRVGLAYYLFPKNPIHLGFQVSYGTVYYDHQSSPDGFPEADKITADVYDKEWIRPIILCRGYEFDITISYLSDQWYFLQAMIGVYTIGNGLKDGGNKWGRTNDSWYENVNDGFELTSLVSSKKPKEEAIPPVGVVFGIGIGFAFEEFFPDDTEVRRRERESQRSKQNQSQLRSSTPSKSAAKRPAPRGRAAEVEEYNDDEY